MLRALAIATCALASARALAGPPAGQVTIDSVDYHGDGCAHGTAAVSVSPDGEAFTVGFSQFAVDVTAAAPGEARLRCSLHLKVTIPPGWSYALARVEYVGFAALDAGVVATRRSTYHLSGEAPEEAVAATLDGNFVGPYAVDAAGGAPLYWSRCGRGKNLTITTELALDNGANPTGGGEVTIDAVDGEVYHLVWQACR